MKITTQLLTRPAFAAALLAGLAAAEAAPTITRLTPPSAQLQVARAERRLAMHLLRVDAR